MKNNVSSISSSCRLGWMLLAAVAFSLLAAYRMANSYLKNARKGRLEHGEAVYVRMPEQFILVNSSVEKMKEGRALTEQQAQHMADSLTALLRYVDDSVLLSRFSTSMLQVLVRSGIPVHVVKSGSKLPVPSDSSLVLDVVQLEAEEFLQPKRSDFVTKQEVYYAYDYNLRHISCNVWLKMGSATESLDSVWFKNVEKSEAFKGKVTSIKDDKATMSVHFDRLTVDDVYRTVEEAGELCATIYVERLLLDHIKRKTGGNENYYYYDAATGQINMWIPYSYGQSEGVIGCGK